jgi:hypothetical protein
MTLRDKAIKNIQKQVRRGKAVPDAEGNPDLGKMLEEFSKGYTQDVTGKTWAQFIEDFLALLSEENRKSLERDIENLRGITNPTKFRRKVIATLAVTFQYGFNAHKNGKDVDVVRMVQEAAKKVGEIEGF